ncbi:High-affinity zinc uptake system protein ZnuA [bacterium HR40]|nr:High-affinity zinc uptake system protein ZnuA [bacterium HR40]
MTRMLALLFVLILATRATPAAEPEVVVTIAPLHSLVAAVAEGGLVPRLLLDPGTSPHSHQLRPSEARLLRQADMIVRVGPSFESFLEHVRETAPKARVVDVLALPLPVLLSYGEGPQSGDDDHGHDAAHEAGLDPHVWLEPANAAAIARAVAEELARLDAPRARLYRHNAETVATELEELARELRVRLAPWRERGFASAHDAFRYFAHAFGLRQAGAFAIDPELPAGAARQAELRRRVASGEIACLAVEPQFAPRAIRELAAQTGVAVAVLDPLGTGLPPGPDLYPALMRRNAEALVDCFSKGRSG